MASGRPTGRGAQPRPAPAATLRVAAVVLAAGRSSRMGRPKALLELDGRTLLAHSLENACAARLAEVVAVVRPEEIDAHRRSAPARVRFVCGQASDAGLSGSLRLGVDALPDDVDAAAILLGDQPGVDAALIDRVVDAAGRSAAPITRPVFVDGGRRTPGHPVVLRRSAFAAVQGLRGDEGARALVAADPASVQEVEVAGAAPPDVDTPEDHARLAGAGGPDAHP